MEIAIDFDGTVVTHNYPHIGADIGSVPVLHELVAEGHKLILWTMRSGEPLAAAIQWFVDNDIKLYGIQRNPTQDRWTTSPKCDASVYIDDAALGAPLTFDKTISDRLYYDWAVAREMLVQIGLLKPQTP